MIDKDRLVQKSQNIIDLNTNSINQLDYYAELLVEYNKKVNLTAITKPEEIEDKHFIDCLNLAAQPFVSGSVCDVGSGAGFPGIVLAIAKPDIELTLIEPTAKRCRFLEFACKELNLNIRIVNDRAEICGLKEYREKFNLVTARAVASMPVLLEYCVPLCSVGGSFVAMKGEAENLTSGQCAAGVLGAGNAEEICYSLPAGEFRRLLIYKKTKKTPKHYPRNAGVISKKPLK